MVKNVDTGCTCRWTFVKGKRELHKDDCPVHAAEDIAAIFDESTEERSRRDPSTGITAPPARGRLDDLLS